MNIFTEKSGDITLCLIGIISPHHSHFGRGVVRFSYAGEEQHADVVQGKRGQKNEARGLLKFPPLRVHVTDARRFFPVLSRLILRTCDSVRSSKLGFFMSTGKITVCGLAFAKCSQPYLSQNPQ